MVITSACIARALAAASFSLAVLAAQAAPAPNGSSPIPDFTGVWSRDWPQPQLFEPPQSGPGPVTGDPASPHIRGANSPWIADLSSPILLPKTRDHLEDLAAMQRSGHALLDNDTVCLPLGVLATLNLFDAMQMLQTPGQVTFLYARDHQVRSAYLNRAHERNAPPSWYGDSVAHYEGDSLVIDTIGMNDKTQVDRYGTLHSQALHTVERYRLSPDGATLIATVTVEDPRSFTMAWSATAHYKREPFSAFEEIVCAENNRPLADSGIKIPAATRPDF